MGWLSGSTEQEEQQEDCLTQLDFACLETLLGPEWRKAKPQHLDFSDPVFQLDTLSIQGTSDRAFAPLKRVAVTTVDISRNRLTTLDDSNFRAEDFPSLVSLRARANAISYVNLILPRLRELSLGRNDLLNIPNLTGLPALEVLVLNHNRIEADHLRGQSYSKMCAAIFPLGLYVFSRRLLVV